MIPDHLVHQFDELQGWFDIGNYACAVIAWVKLARNPAAWYCEDFYIADIRCLCWLGKTDEAREQLNRARTLHQLGLLK